MLKRFSRRCFALLALPLVLTVASCRTRDSTDASSRLRATKPVVASYGDHFQVFYHWGDASFLDRLTNNHIPNHIYPGEEKAYGYYSDGLYQDIMNKPYAESNARGAGLYVASDPTSSMQFAFLRQNPKLIEVIIDKRIAETNTLMSLRDGPSQVYDEDWFVIKKNKGVYFREFSGAGFTAEELETQRENFIRKARFFGKQETDNDGIVKTFLGKIDGFRKNPLKDKVRLLPPREWVCGQD